MKNTFPVLLLILLTAAVLFPLVASAEVDNDRFQDANAMYSRGDFTGAVTLYEELINSYGYSASLLYNLANSYAQAGNTGRAVLNYERALKLDPNDPDILANLQLVRSANGLFNPEETTAEHLLHVFSMNRWIGLGAMALIVVTGVSLLSLWARISSRAMSLVIVCSVAVMVAAAIAVLELRGEWDGSVVVHESRLLISPFGGAATAGNIREGRMVHPGKKHGAYVFVEDETGRKGWLEQSAVEPVIPPTIRK